MSSIPASTDSVNLSFPPSPQFQHYRLQLARDGAAELSAGADLSPGPGRPGCCHSCFAPPGRLGSRATSWSWLLDSLNQPIGVHTVSDGSLVALACPREVFKFAVLAQRRLAIVLA